MPRRAITHVLFCAQLAVLDVIVRGPGFYAAHPRALLHAVASAALLHLSTRLAGQRAGRVALAAMLGLVVASQLAFFRYYHAPIDDQVALAARQAWQDVRPMLLGALPAILLVGCAVAAAEYAWLGYVGLEPPRGRIAALAVAIGLLLGGPLRNGTLEVRTAHAAASLALAPRPVPLVGRPSLPALGSVRSRVPNVLFILTESVRASDWCGDPRAPCELAPEVHALLPDRVTLEQMRSISAYTALSLSALLTGLPQMGPRLPILSAPDLFDVVRATRDQGARVGIHYWSAHSGTVFERTDVPGAVDSYVSADTMLGRAIDDVEDAVAGGLDRRLADTCEARLATLPPPYFVLAHFSGTHAPYFFEDDRAPFLPFQRHATWSGLQNLHRAYQNAIVEQDRSIARCIRAFLSAARGGPWVVVFTSDHGEAFGEHSAIHHGQNLYDEQVHVPAFVAHGGGALGADEARALEATRSQYRTHLDLFPTLLDLLGVLDHFALAAARAPMPGASLLRPRADPLAPMPVSNCSAMWQCPINGWAVFADGRKLVAQPWDRDWRCMSLERGEEEIPLARCGDLATFSRGAFAKKPNGEPND